MYRGVEDVGAGYDSTLLRKMTDRMKICDDQLAGRRTPPKSLW
jgi:hypothetical protein